MPQFEGFPVPLELLPPDARALIAPNITIADLDIRLRATGPIIFDNASFIVGRAPDFSSNAFAFIACDEFALRNRAGIITNGNILVIICNRFTSEDGCSVVAFEPSARKAANGTSGVGLGRPGDPGAPGDFGGLVSIHVIQDFVGILNVDLSGQDGGDGGAGAQGAQGTAGAGGRDSETRITIEFPGIPFPRCVVEAQSGHNGGIGLPGGTGGNGGSGGSGGIFELFNVGSAPVPDASFVFRSDGGAGGVGGSGGAGGPGGPGGSGGRGSFSCHGALPGAPGAIGPRGEDGQGGAAGAAGRNIVRNLDLEVLISSGARTLAP